MVPGLDGEIAPVRFGLVGAGRIAHSYTEAFQSTSGAQLVAITDVRLDVAARLAEPLKIPAVATTEHLVSDIGIDAVVIATPPDTHRDLSLFFLERGIPVLCEKPVSTSTVDAHRIRNAARANSTLFTMASKFRYVEDVIRAKSIVTSGILGDIVLFENAFFGRVDMSTRWNANPAISGGGVLMDNGTHSVDIMRYFLGSLAEIHVAEARRTQQLNVEETVQVTVRSQGGVLGKCDLSWSLTKPSDYYISIFGSQGSLRVGWKESWFQQEGNSAWVPFGNGYKKVAAFRSQLENFAGTIRGTDQLLITANDAIASAEAIDAGYQSLSTGRWQTISSVPRALAATA